jgi:hypothetical protein
MPWDDGEAIYASTGQARLELPVFLEKNKRNKKWRETVIVRTADALPHSAERMWMVSMTCLMEKPRRRPAFLFLMRVLLEKYQILRERIQCCPWPRKETLSSQPLIHRDEGLQVVPGNEGGFSRHRYGSQDDYGTAETEGCRCQLKHLRHGVHWRAYTAVHLDAKSLMTRAEPSVFYREPKRISAPSSRRWQGESRVLDAFLRDLSIPLRNM